MLNLFEYKNKVHIPDSLTGIEAFLDDIWSRREKSGHYYAMTEEEERTETQRFIQFFHQTQEMKSNKYVGVICFNGEKINLLPKIFYDKDSPDGYDRNQIMNIQNHILWWLSYCRKIKFPRYQTTRGTRKSDFFEVLIYIFAKYTRELLNSFIYQNYEEENRELPYIKGRLDVKRYITDNLSKANWHRLNCRYDAFIMDNTFNRIVKYVANLLFHTTTNQENKQYLREILFILDEVTDIKATAKQCTQITFNPMFGEFETVRDYCYLFLSNSISFNYKNDLKLFAFLLPMEYVFEDFIYGFIEKEIPEVTVKGQISNTYLDHEHNFQLRPDLLLKQKGKAIIADTKYKVIYSDEKDPKKGISQNDLYQMLAYAVRFNVDDIILLYPNTVNNYQATSTTITIQDTLADNQNITVRAYQLPILDNNLSLTDSNTLQEQFDPLRVRLIGKIKRIIKYIY